MLHFKSSYMQALAISLREELVDIKEIDTIFIGGGTPSTVEPKLYEPIFKLLEPLVKEKIEITCEANPNSATKQWLKGMLDLGVNRLSFGVQSFNEEKLKLLNRAHSSKDAIDAISNAYSIGFKNISLDIIYDLYSDTQELIVSDLEQAFKLPINHISSYELTIDKATEFSKREEVKLNDENLGFLLRKEVEKRGFKQYEVSNYGIYQSKHNLGYWQHKEYLGIGAGAVGYRDKKRYKQHTNIEKFIAEPTYKSYESLNSSNILTEKILLGLRSIVGVDSHILDNSMLDRASFLAKEGKLELRNGTFYNKELFLSDELALFIIEN